MRKYFRLQSTERKAFFIIIIIQNDNIPMGIGGSLFLNFLLLKSCFRMKLVAVKKGQIMSLQVNRREKKLC